MSWYLIICSFALLLFTFLHEGTCVCACNMPTCDCEPRTGHAAGRLHTLWILLAAVLSLKQCVPPKPPAPPLLPLHHPTVDSPFPGAQRPAVACGWVLHPGCQREGLLGIGLWWKCSIRACLSAPRSTSSWLSVLAGLQSVAQTCNDWLSLAWKWKDRPQNRHIHSGANEKEVVSNV